MMNEDEIEKDDDNEVEIEMTDERTDEVEVDISDDDDESPVTSEIAQEHFADIKEDVDSYDLSRIVEKLLSAIDDDKEARQDRDTQYERGLQLTGIAEPAPKGADFPNASRVTHPLLAEAAVDFASRVMKEIFPPNGPVKSKILGEQDYEKIKKAEVKTEFMNWQATEQIIEFRSELEQATTQVPIAGAHYVKLYWCDVKNRPVVENIPMDYIHIPANASSFLSASRKTHEIHLTTEEFEQRYGDDIDAPDADGIETGAQIATDKIQGVEKNSLTYADGNKVVYEVYTSFEIEDGHCPYIITIESQTRKVLRLVRNWMPDDEMMVELQHIVELPFLPWRGSLPIGMAHLIGDLSSAATGALRALMDSAHIQNIPSAIKLKGGLDGEQIDMVPGSITSLDGNPLDGDIRKLVMPLPFNPPSPILMQLLEYLVVSAKGVVNTSMEKLSDQNPNAPVGTTLALIEQGMVVFSEIHHRIHNSMGRVFNILHRLNKCYLTDEYLERLNTGIKISPSDFDGVMDIIPVSDPHIFSEAQRFAQTQALLQRAQALPQLYDARKVEERFLEQMKIPANDVLMPLPGSENLDPVSENVSLAMGRPVAVLPQQSHLAHLRVHIAYYQSPVLMNEETKQRALYPLAMHLLEHLQQYYLTETHEAVDQVMKFDETAKESSDEQATIILQAQKNIEEGLASVMPIIMDIVKEAQQYKPQPQQQDPAIAIETMRGEQRMQLEQMKVQADMQSKQMQLQAEQQAQMAKQQHDMQIEQIRQQAENERESAKLQLTSDLARAELITGANVSNATGLPTGV